jgi:nucleotide-binding universal stress UspA family protein
VTDTFDWLVNANPATMKKILLAVGERELSTTALDFACYLARLTKSPLTGIFLETVTEHQLLPESVLAESGAARPVSIKENKSVQPLTDRQITRFIDGCVARDVVALVYQPHKIKWKELIRETRFADAIIMDSEFTMQAQLLEEYPSHYARKLLHEAECPVIVTPLSFDSIQEIILTYDGSKTSLFAIREFLHLFPELRETKATILQIWLEEDEHPKEQERLLEWLRNHFSNVESIILKGESDQRLMEYLLRHPQSFVVMGGFGRSRASRMLQPSTSGTIVKLVSSPVFIAHR